MVPGIQGITGKGLLLGVLAAIFLSLGYMWGGAWWKFVPSTLLIVASVQGFYRSESPILLGFRGSITSWLAALFLCLIFFLTAKPLIGYVVRAQGFLLEDGDFLSQLMVPLQSLNEELVFRALLLSAMLRMSFKSWQIILLPALVFSLFHLVFYGYLVNEANQGSISMSALATMFLFGVTANLLFLMTGSIAFPWAFHCGWNLCRFAGRLVSPGSPSTKVREVESFALIEGSPLVLGLSALLMLTCLGFFFFQKGRREFAAGNMS